MRLKGLKQIRLPALALKRTQTSRPTSNVLGILLIAVNDKVLIIPPHPPWGGGRKREFFRGYVHNQSF